MRYDIVLLLLLLPPSSVRSAKPKATGTAQKGIRGYFAQVVKTQQNADDDAAHDISDDGTAKTKDGTKWIKCERKTFEFTRGVNKGAILVTYYPWYEAEPSVATMKEAHSRMMKDPKQRAADRNRRYAYSSN